MEQPNNDFNVDDFLTDVNESAERHRFVKKDFLPQIDMSQKAWTSKKGVTSPGFFGNIRLLPVVDQGTKRPVVFLSEVYLISVWNPKLEKFEKRKLLETKLYDRRVEIDQISEDGVVGKVVVNEGLSQDMKERIEALRSKCETLMDNKIPFTYLQRKNYAITKSFVVHHKDSKNNVIVSKIRSKDTLTPHVNIPALVIFPSAEVSKKITDDLNLKTNASVYSSAVYTKAPLSERKAWVTISFNQKDNNQVGYSVTVLHDILNPAVENSVLPEGYIIDPKDIQLIENSDLIQDFLKYEHGENNYLTPEGLSAMENAVNKFMNNDYSESNSDDEEDYDEDDIDPTTGKPYPVTGENAPKVNNNSSDDPFNSPPSNEVAPEDDPFGMS